MNTQRQRGPPILAMRLVSLFISCSSCFNVFNVSSFMAIPQTKLTC